VQVNNAWVFPAIGHAAVLTQCTCITDDIFLAAAKQLSSITSVDQVEQGFLFPPFSAIRTVSCLLIARLAALMVAQGLGKEPQGMTTSWEEYVASKMFTVPSSRL
jgi:malate dehydrogenase (oxaloacetate-decarboxylating)(NADP+)